jgi:hypothetical protein
MLKALLLALALLLVPVGARAERDPTPRDVAEAMRACLDIDAIGDTGDEVTIFIAGGPASGPGAWQSSVMYRASADRLRLGPVYIHRRYPTVVLFNPPISPQYVRDDPGALCRPPSFRVS